MVRACIHIYKLGQSISNPRRNMHTTMKGTNSRVCVCALWIPIVTWCWLGGGDDVALITVSGGAHTCIKFRLSRTPSVCAVRIVYVSPMQLCIIHVTERECARARQLSSVSVSDVFYIAAAIMRFSHLLSWQFSICLLYASKGYVCVFVSMYSVVGSPWVVSFDEAHNVQQTQF